jgi:hypothetical protein
LKTVRVDTGIFVPPSAVDLLPRGTGFNQTFFLVVGADHMSAMKMIDGVHAAGGKVRSFVSSCGGLPAPAAADNPLGYKFSWNPRGAILAGRNAATYKRGGKVVQVEGEGPPDCSWCPPALS